MTSSWGFFNIFFYFIFNFIAQVALQLCGVYGYAHLRVETNQGKGRASTKRLVSIHVVGSGAVAIVQVFIQINLRSARDVGEHMHPVD